MWAVSAAAAAAPKLKLVLPKSWYTAPPPLCRRTSVTPRLSIWSRRHSRQAHWLRPKITLLALRHKYSSCVSGASVLNRCVSTAMFRNGSWHAWRMTCSRRIAPLHAKRKC